MSPRSEHSWGICPLYRVTPGTWWHASSPVASSHQFRLQSALLSSISCALSVSQCVGLSSHTPFTNTSRCLTSEWLLWILGPCSSYPVVLAITALPTRPQPPSDGCVAGAPSRTMIQCNSVAGALGPGIPHVINTKLLKQFTCLTYNNGRSGAGAAHTRARGGGGSWEVAVKGGGSHGEIHC